MGRYIVHFGRLVLHTLKNEVGAAHYTPKFSRGLDSRLLDAELELDERRDVLDTIESARQRRENEGERGWKNRDGEWGDTVISEGDEGHDK